MTPDPNRPDRPYWPPLAALRGWWLDLRYQIGRLRVPSARDPDDAAEGTTSLSRIADPDDVDEVLGDDSFGFGDLPGISKLDPDWGKYITHLECEVERLREEWGKSDRGREDAGTE
ncbi:MAG TPA: hypothetical protein VK611_30275, partial [Acidimicrobiales bacterium]|nr:hypothetical protein [Acidimicrobiales bacterium]